MIFRRSLPLTTFMKRSASNYCHPAHDHAGLALVWQIACVSIHGMQSIRSISFDVFKGFDHRGEKRRRLIYFEMTSK